MKLRDFDATDWMGFAGAERPLNHDPKIGEDCIIDNCNSLVIIDRDGIEIYVMDSDNYSILVTYVKHIPFIEGVRLMSSLTNDLSSELLLQLGFDEL